MPLKKALLLSGTTLQQDGNQSDHSAQLLILKTKETGARRSIMSENGIVYPEN